VCGEAAARVVFLFRSSRAPSTPSPSFPGWTVSQSGVGLGDGDVRAHFSAALLSAMDRTGDGMGGLTRVGPAWLSCTPRARGRGSLLRQPSVSGVILTPVTVGPAVMVGVRSVESSAIPVTTSQHPLWRGTSVLVSPAGVCGRLGQDYFPYTAVTSVAVDLGAAGVVSVPPARVFAVDATLCGMYGAVSHCTSYICPYSTWVSFTP
jgi:hypothetical protein